MEMKIWGRWKMEDGRERVRRLEIKERRDRLWEIEERGRGDYK